MNRLTKRTSQIILLVFVANIIFTGCMTVPIAPGLTPVADSTKPIKLQGFSVLPPQGEDWFISTELQSKYYVAFAKGFRGIKNLAPANLDYIIAHADLYIVDPQFKTHNDIFEHIKREKLARVDENQRLLEFNDSKDSSLGLDCIKYEGKVESRGVPQFPDKIFIVKRHGFACLHPDYPQYVANVAYFQRYLQGKQPLPIDTEVEPFLMSLKFSSLTLAKPFVDVILPMSAPQGMIFSHGTLWVVEMAKNRVSRIDPKTNTIVTTISIGKKPVGITADKDAVWVVNKEDGTVSRIDPNTNTVAATIRVGKKPLNTISGEGSVWITNSYDNTVTRINPQTNEVVATIKVGKSPSGVAIGEGAVWVTNYGSDTISKIDPGTNRVAATIATGKNPNLVLIDKSTVWVTNAGSGSVSRIDPKINAAVDEIYTGGSPAGLTAVHGAIWVTTWDDNNIVRINPQTNRIIGNPIPVGVSPLYITGDEKAVWVCNAHDNTVMRIEP